MTQQTQSDELQLAYHDLHNMKVAQRVFLKKLIPLLKDAVDGVEIGYNDVAISHILSVISQIEDKLK